MELLEVSFLQFNPCLDIDTEVGENVLKELTALRKQVEELQEAEKLVNDVSNTLSLMHNDNLVYLTKQNTAEKMVEQLKNELNVVKDLDRFIEEVSYKITHENNLLRSELNKAVELTKHMDSMKTHLEELDRKHRDSTRREDDLISMLAEMKQNTEDVKIELKYTQENLVAEKSKVTSVSNVISEQRDKLENENAELIRSVEQKREQIEDMDNKVLKLNKKNENFKTKVEELTKEIEALKSAQSQAGGNKNSSSGRNSVAEKNSAATDKYIAQVKLLKERLSNLENIESQYTEAKANITKAKNHSLKSEREVKCLKSERDVLLVKINTLETELEGERANTAVLRKRNIFSNVIDEQTKNLLSERVMSPLPGSTSNRLNTPDILDKLPNETISRGTQTSKMPDAIEIETPVNKNLIDGEQELELADQIRHNSNSTSTSTSTSKSLLSPKVEATKFNVEQQSTSSLDSVSSTSKSSKTNMTKILSQKFNLKDEKTIAPIYGKTGILSPKSPPKPLVSAKKTSQSVAPMNSTSKNASLNDSSASQSSKAPESRPETPVVTANEDSTLFKINLGKSKHKKTERSVPGDNTSPAMIKKSTSKIILRNKKSSLQSDSSGVSSDPDDQPLFPIPNSFTRKNSMMKLG